MKILDVGCGSNPKGDVNVDLFVEPIQRAEKQRINPKKIKNFVFADAHYLPFRDDIFQVVYSSHLLEHCLHPFTVLKEYRRVSKAIVYLEVPYGDRYPDDCPHHLYSWTMKSFQHLLLKIFPYVQIHATERVAHNLRSGKWQKTLIGALLLIVFRKIRHTILWRKQLTAICYKFPAKIVYTVSDKGSMISDVLNSIKNVRKFFNRKDIFVFYTPPRNKENLYKLNKLAIVKEVPNITQPFIAFPHKGLSHYGEKIHLCDVDSLNVIFLDADTVIKKNPLPLLIGDYDFSARVGNSYYSMDRKIWNDMFRKFRKQIVPLPNTGFMIFKNYCHREIKQEWLRFVNSTLPNPLKHSYLKEQYALALALSGKKIKWMTKKEHAFRWEGEFGWKSYVVHGSANTLLKKLSKLFRNLKRS